MSNPIFSIVLPSFNRVHTLPETIVSVMNQIYSNLKVLLIDDGSSDDSKTMPNKVINKDLESCVRIIRNEMLHVNIIPEKWIQVPVNL